MIAILDDAPCVACGGRHALWVDDHRQAWANREFAYTCPTTGQAGNVRTAAWDRLTPDPPADGVRLRPAGG